MKKVQLNQTNPQMTIDAAKNGVVVDVSSYGPQTLAIQLVLSSPSSPSGITAQLQGSVDGVNFFNDGSPINLTIAGALVITAANVFYKMYRISYARTSGSIQCDETYFLYGDAI